jgi:hypothetical protein
MDELILSSSSRSKSKSKNPRNFHMTIPLSKWGRAGLRRGARLECLWAAPRPVLATRIILPGGEEAGLALRRKKLQTLRLPTWELTTTTTARAGEGCQCGCACHGRTS